MNSYRKVNIGLLQLILQVIIREYQIENSLWCDFGN